MSNPSINSINNDINIINLFINMFENIPVPMIIIDKKEKIRFITKYYADFLKVKKEDALGSHIHDIIENSRLPIVLKTGEAELAFRHKYLDGREVIVDKYPIKENGEVIGCFAILTFTSIEELQELAKKNQNLETKLNYYQKELNTMFSANYTLDDIIGISPEIKGCKENVKKFSNSKSTVLIQGESGVGKELFAHAIHNESDRKSQPFIRINCAAIPESLFESELFGYDEGAFTGAKKGGNIGKFELANTGTIFLDEIGEMPLSMQAKILRVLQEKEISRIGGNKSIPLDVRVIAATNNSLENLLEQGKLRKDLFYRLNVLNLTIPPLRDRKVDIPILIEHILSELYGELGIYKQLTKDVVYLLERFYWPGNVRELKAVLEKVIINTDKDKITKKDIPLSLLKKFKVSNISFSKNGLNDILEETEKETIKKALELAENNKAEAARILRIPRPRLYRKLEKYNLS